MERLKQFRIWRYFKSLRLRFFVILCLIGLLSCAIIKYAIMVNYEAREIEVRKNELQARMRVLANRLIEQRAYLAPMESEAGKELVLLAEIYEGRLRVLDGTLTVVGDTERKDEGETLSSEDLERCLSGTDYEGRDSYDNENNLLTVMVPLLLTQTETRPDEKEEVTALEETVHGVLFAEVSTETVRATLGLLTATANRIQWIVVLSVIFLAALFSDVLLRPFDRITRAINEVKAGYTDEPISVPDYIETEEITDAFNQLQARMKTLDDSRQEFVSNVSHELKTPITSMKVLADTLLGQEDAPVEMYRDFLTDISEEIGREDEIINDLLALVRMDKQAAPLNITTVNINEMTEIVCKRLRPIARQRNIDLTLESTREISAEIDEVKISLAIMNLVENAIKYNNDGGWVRVELDADSRDFTLKVSDSGIGMPQEELDHIYDRFYRVDKSRSKEIGGTGLGLSVTRQAILMHRGEIEAQSTEGVGTIFTVRLPLIYVSAEQGTEQKRAGRRPWEIWRTG